MQSFIIKLPNQLMHFQYHQHIDRPKLRVVLSTNVELITENMHCATKIRFPGGFH